jgi:hypothetical protein
LFFKKAIRLQAGKKRYGIRSKKTLFAGSRGLKQETGFIGSEALKQKAVSVNNEARKQKTALRCLVWETITKTNMGLK